MSFRYSSARVWNAKEVTPMTWWNVAGIHWGWGACLLAVMMLFAFWGAVIAALTALLGANRPQRRQDIEIQRDAQVPGLTATDYVAPPKPPPRP
jgi:hypothetical protein